MPATKPNRVKKGVPAGGQYAHKTTPEADVLLDRRLLSGKAGPVVGEPSGFFKRNSVIGRDPIPVMVTEHNKDLLAGLTQEDFDQRSRALHAAASEELEQVHDRFSRDDFKLPDDPTPENLQRLAENIDDAFGDSVSELDGARRTGPHPILSDVYGTPDRAVVALGEAVGNRADQLAKGYGEGGAEDTERWWLERSKEAEDARLEKEGALRSGVIEEPEERNAARAFMGDCNRIEAGIDPKTRQALGDMSDAYRAALAEVRPMGGTFELHEASAKPGSKIVQATADVWPSDWIDASNQSNRPLHIGAANRRGHYSHSKIIEEKKRGQGTFVMAGRTGVDGQMDLSPQRMWSDSPAKGRSYTFYEPLSDEGYEKQGWTRDQNPNAVVEKEWTVLTDDDVADRELWGQKNITKGFKRATDPNFQGGQPFWRKPKTRMNTESRFRASQISLGQGRVGVPTQDARYPIAVHEVGHRMEYLAPNINRMTHAWLERRVEESADKEAKQIYRGTREYGYRDDFVDHYVGKVYTPSDGGGMLGRDDATKADGFDTPTEVFSMGSDSLFGGQQGGLIGLSRTAHPDKDMKSFTLGVFASAGMSKRNKGGGRR